MNLMGMLVPFIAAVCLLQTAQASNLRSSSAVAADAFNKHRSSSTHEATAAGRNLDNSRKLADVQIDTNDPFRIFFREAIMKLPNIETTIERDVLGTLSLNLTDFRCFDADYEAIRLTLLESQSADVADDVQLEITDFIFNCNMNIGWGYGNLNGAGSASVVSNKNYLTAIMSTDPSENSQTGEEEQNCEGANIDIDELVFEGDLSIEVLNVFRGFIGRIVENRVDEIFCGLLHNQVLNMIWNVAETKIEEFSTELPSWRTNPLHLEIDNPGDDGIIIFGGEDPAGELMAMALRNLNEIYSVRKPDSTASTADGLDYGFNTIMREKIMDGKPYCSRSNLRQITKAQSPLVDIDIKKTDIRIKGLDGAAFVSPIAVIGNKTIQNTVSFNNMTIEVEMSVTAAASTREDSIFFNADQLEPIVENFTGIVQVDNLDITLSFFVPLNRTQVENLPMGYILNWQSLPSCIPPVLSNMVLSGLDVTIGNIHEPVVLGLQSQDLGRLVESFAHIGMASFEERVLEAIPGLFQAQIRDIVSESLLDFRCPVEEEVLRRLEEEDQHVYRRLEEEEDFELPTGADLYFNIIGAFVCVCMAALAAGLTMGLLSLDELMLLIKQRAGATEQERKAAGSLLPIVRQHHLLLVSLLLLNSIANEALPLFLDKVVPGYAAVIISVTLVLFFGEIIPSAVFTGPDQIKLASRLAPLVRTVMFILSPIAYPIAKVLDHILHEEDDPGYNRGELSALVRIQYEEHLATKRRRKSQISKTIKEFDSMQSSLSSEVTDSYAERRTSGKAVRPEIKETIRAMKRQLSHRKKSSDDDLYLDEVTMVEGALQMGTTVATDVYTPWSQVFAIPNDMILTERNAVKIYRSGYSRIPVYLKNKDNPKDNTKIIGILAAKTLMVVDSQDKRAVATLPLSTPRCVAPRTSLVDLVNMFQVGGVKGGHIAFVCTYPEDAHDALKNGKPIPEDAGLMGVITLEDVLESLIQEQIYDETDRDERKKAELARWGWQRWRHYVKKSKKRRGDMSYASIPSQPKMLSVVEEAVSQGKEEEKEEAPPATETTSLLGRLNPFR